MSLYYEAAEILEITDRNGASIKSIVFQRKDWKSAPKALFALATETAKWSEVLCEVIEKSALLKAEKQLTPRLALLLTHDLLLAKKGLALSPKHGLYNIIIRQRARLSGELTKVRLRRGFATLDALKAHINSENFQGSQHSTFPHPRWVRVNTLRNSLEEQLASNYAAYTRTDQLKDITLTLSKKSVLYVDEHVPNLIAVPPDVDITRGIAYKEGKLILQDKASCFPAYLLDPSSIDGDIIDACAAPGNKTTHLAALISTPNGTDKSGPGRRKIIACERDGPRSETLEKIVKLASASDVVRIKAKQDFLKLDPHSAELANVTGILLDPSCSGSGIVGRDETSLNIRLPSVHTQDVRTQSKKRKRGRDKLDVNQAEQHLAVDAEAEEVPTELVSSISALEVRLAALSSFQLRLVEHAMAFPSASRITYSTCSVHNEENEGVVVKALLSDIATKRGWKILRREEQVEGLRKWHRRGNMEGVSAILERYGKDGTDLSAKEIADACLICEKAGEDGTMGFFVAGFVRDSNSAVSQVNIHSLGSNDVTEDGGPEDEWNGFSDNERGE